MSFWDFLFPVRCVGCGKIGSYICDRCATRVRPVLPAEHICPMCLRPALDGVTHPRCVTRYGLSGLTSFFHYGGPVREAIRTVKYRLVRDLAGSLVARVSAGTLRMIPLASCLVPIPLYIRRLRDRGFNQAELFGGLVATSLQARMETDILVRIRNTPPQVLLQHRQLRLRNMAGAFAVRGKVPDDILLFDDVFTTGTTLREAANVLKRHGAKRVWGITMAR